MVALKILIVILASAIIAIALYGFVLSVKENYPKEKQMFKICLAIWAALTTFGIFFG